MIMSKIAVQEALDVILESQTKTDRLREIISRIGNYDDSAVEELQDYLNRVHADIVHREERDGAA